MATATDYAWAAGFFDGEGCVSLHLHAKKSGYQYPLTQIILVQKDRRPLDVFHALFGAVETIGRTLRGPHRRPYWRLVYSGQRAAIVLTALLPYLTLKREVAEVALALQQDIDRFSRQVRATGLPPETMAYRLSLIERAKWLNSGRWRPQRLSPATPSSGDGDAIVRAAGIVNLQRLAEMPSPADDHQSVSNSTELFQSRSTHGVSEVAIHTEVDRPADPGELPVQTDERRRVQENRSIRHHQAADAHGDAVYPAVLGGSLGTLMQLHVAYIAGYFDADGCVTAHFGQQANRAYRPWVGIDLCFFSQNFAMLDEIRESLGCGRIRPVLNATGSGCYRLEFTRPDTRTVLALIQPYVRLKREQVALALELAKTINPRRGGKGRAKITDEEQQLRQYSVARISELNRRDGKVFRTKWVNSVNLSVVPDVTTETIPSQAVEGRQVLRKV